MANQRRVPEPIDTDDGPGLLGARAEQAKAEDGLKPLSADVTSRFVYDFRPFGGPAGSAYVTYGMNSPPVAKDATSGAYTKGTVQAGETVELQFSLTETGLIGLPNCSAQVADASGSTTLELYANAKYGDVSGGYQPFPVAYNTTNTVRQMGRGDSFPITASDSISAGSDAKAAVRPASAWAHASRMTIRAGTKQHRVAAAPLWASSPTFTFRAGPFDTTATGSLRFGFLMDYSVGVFHLNATKERQFSP